MNYCQEIQKLTEILDSATPKEKIEARKKLLKICDHIPDVTEEFKIVKKGQLKKEIDDFLKNPTLRDGFVIILRTNLMQLFGCTGFKKVEL